jgi:hypothetical protein
VAVVAQPDAAGCIPHRVVGRLELLRELHKKRKCDNDRVKWKFARIAK